MVVALVMLALAGRPGAEPPSEVYAPTLDGPPTEHSHAHGDLQAPIDPTLEGPALQTPWPCGQIEYCTQGHNGGSHTGTSSWAWDFAHQEGEEIWAASAGVVTHLRMDMVDGGCDSAFANAANYITIDHGDGTSIAYLHMQPNSSPLSVGETVEVGDLVARVGQTGWACGAHLHMQVQQTCGGYYCQSVTASFADYGDPSAGVQYEGTNCPSCPAMLDGGQTVIDDEDAGCLVRQTTAWWSSYQGHGDHHFWTRAIDAGAPESSALWRFGVSVPGDYRVEVFVPDADASTTNARYLVHHAGGTAEIAIDQSTNKGWQDLGVYEFVGGGGESIELGDDTGENVSLDRHIAYDAVRLTYEPAGGETGVGETGTDPDGTGGTDPDGTGGSDPGGTGGGMGSGGGVGSGGGPGGDPGEGTAWDGDESGRSLPPGFGEGPDSGGCACRSDGRAPGRPAGVLGLLVLVLLRRRRRSGRV